MRNLLWPHAVQFYGQTEQGDEAKSVRAFANFVLARNLREVKPHLVNSRWSHYKRNFPDSRSRREFWIMAEQAGWVRPVGTFDRNSQIASEYQINPLAFDGRFSEAIRQAKIEAARYRNAMPQAMLEQQAREPGQD